MAIIGSGDLTNRVTKLGRRANDQLKHHILSMLGYPVVNVEITEPQIEQVIRVTHDFISMYFPLEERYSFFTTDPLVAEYPIPSDAYWVSEVIWHPGTSNIANIFSIDYIMFNAANITGYQSLVSDFDMIRQYQKFANRVLGLEGKWEYLPGNEASEDRIHLYPIPKGAFPVIVRYVPVVTNYRSPQAKEVAYRVMVAKAKEMVGMARRKVSSVPGPDGGQLGLDGDAMVQEGKAEYEQCIKDALALSEPLRPYFG
jgi:hypothetical protein